MIDAQEVKNAIDAALPLIQGEISEEGRSFSASSHDQGVIQIGLSDGVPEGNEVEIFISYEEDFREVQIGVFIDPQSSFCCLDQTTNESIAARQRAEGFFDTLSQRHGFVSICSDGEIWGVGRTIFVNGANAQEISPKEDIVPQTMNALCVVQEVVCGTTAATRH